MLIPAPQARADDPPGDAWTDGRGGGCTVRGGTRMDASRALAAIIGRVILKDLLVHEIKVQYSPLQNWR